jgi:hypothetical protein
LLPEGKPWVNLREYLRVYLREYLRVYLRATKGKLEGSTKSHR